VLAFKELLKEKLGVAVDQQRLIYRGRVMKNEDSLADGSVLHLVERPSHLPPSAPSTSNGNGSGSGSVRQVPVDVRVIAVDADENGGVGAGGIVGAISNVLGVSLPPWLVQVIERTSGARQGNLVESTLTRLESANAPSSTPAAEQAATTDASPGRTLLRVASQLELLSAALRERAALPTPADDAALAARTQSVGSLLLELSPTLSTTSTSPAAVAPPQQTVSGVTTTPASTTDAASERAPSGITPAPPPTTLHNVLTQSVLALNNATSANLNGIVESVAPLLAGLSPAWRHVQHNYQPLIDSVVQASGAAGAASSINAAVLAASSALPPALGGALTSSRAASNTSTSLTSSRSTAVTASTASATATPSATASVTTSNDDSDDGDEADDARSLALWASLLRAVVDALTVPELVRTSTGDWAPLQRTAIALRQLLDASAGVLPRALPRASALRRAVPPASLSAQTARGDACAAAARVARESAVSLVACIRAASDSTFGADVQTWARTAVRDLVSAVRAQCAHDADVQPLLRWLVTRVFADGAPAQRAVMLSNMTISYVAREYLGATPAVTPVSIPLATAANNASTAPSVAATSTAITPTKASLAAVATAAATTSSVSTRAGVSAASLTSLPVAWREQVALDVARQQSMRAQPPLSPMYSHGRG
jgi:hypothetical protein